MAHGRQEALRRSTRAEEQIEASEGLAAIQDGDDGDDEQAAKRRKTTLGLDRTLAESKAKTIRQKVVDYLDAWDTDVEAIKDKIKEQFKDEQDGSLNSGGQEQMNDIDNAHTAADNVGKKTISAIDKIITTISGAPSYKECRLYITIKKY